MVARSLLDWEREELAAWLAERGQPAYRADQILSWAHARRTPSPDEMTDVPLGLRRELMSECPGRPPKVVLVKGSADSTRKYLLELADGQKVETVLIPASPALYGSRSDRLTLCVSSQVGCALGCRFCASGLDGWKRHLSAGEIVAQVYAVEAAAGVRINNIVFMGMGEPFANFSNVMKAIRILNAPWGAKIGARHMTVSTSGVAPRIRDFANQPLQVRLAVSLHGATDEVRERIMPVNKRYPLAELLDACAYFTHRKSQFLTFEFILIEGVNDSLAQARKLADLARPLQAKVNLIPYNTVEGLGWRRPSEAVQKGFLRELRAAGVRATLRKEKGHDIAAACGQLRLVEARLARALDGDQEATAMG